MHLCSCRALLIITSSNRRATFPLCPLSIFLWLPFCCHHKMKWISLHESSNSISFSVLILFSDSDYFKSNGTFFLLLLIAPLLPALHQSIMILCPPVPSFLCLCLTVPSCHWAHLLHPAVNYGGGLQTGMQLRVHLTHWPTLVMSFPSHWSKSQSHTSPEFSQLIYFSTSFAVQWAGILSSAKRFPVLL